MKKICCILCVVVLVSSYVSSSFAGNIKADVMVFKSDSEFTSVDTLESEGRVYLEMNQLINFLSLKLEKDGKIYRIVDSKTKEENAYINDSTDEVYIGKYNEDGTFQEGQMFWADGKAYKGTFINNLPDGTGEMLYANGNVFVGDFEKGFPHGEGQFYFKDGGNYLGQVRYGTITGYGRLRYSNKDVYKGYLYMGLFHGAGVFSEYDGGTKQGLWNYGEYVKYMNDEDIKLYLFDK